MKTQRRLLLAGVVSGAVLVLAPLVELLHGVRGAFSTLRTSGIGDPHSLAGSLAEILASVAIFLPLAVVGLILLIVSIVKYRQLRALAEPPSPAPVFH